VSRLIDYYGKDGWTPDADRAPLDRERRALDMIVRLISAASPGRRLDVLDVGCGDGGFLAHLDAHLRAVQPDREVRFVGTDYSAHQLELAARLPYEFHQCDLNIGIPLPDSTMDIVYAGEVIEHLYDPDMLVDECVRVLRPGGSLVVTTPNPHAWYNRALFVAGVQPLFFVTSSRSTDVGAGPRRRLKKGTRPVGHLRLFNRTALLDLLHRAGLERQAVRGAGFHALPRAVSWVDNVFSRWPTFASNLIVLARKPVARGDGASR
jgi:SAM-dependent methyltransferase